MSLTEKWTKSTRSDSGGNCVEVRRSRGGNIHVRDSKDPEGPVLTPTPSEWSTFISGMRAGDLYF
jgi:hypothetical protein